MSGKQQIRIVRGDASAAQATRPLYEQAFDDPPAFVDYYYREKMKDSTVITLEEENGVLSMLHLNPYTVSVRGTCVPSYYVVAVATDRLHRRKGYMTRVLDAAFAEMERERVPFCFLLPVDEAIYLPSGFETICDFITRDNPLSALSYGAVRERFDVFCVQDAVYERRRHEEDRLAALDAAEVLPENPVIMARVTDREAYDALFPDARANTGGPAGAGIHDGRLQALRALRCYFREEV
ncbi:MAG: GNAT family N-acetyltransferase [Lachnospiraceae bacterium]|nr:GNAT family N-acetyltransferase [Lachnospiraceae bacterium]